MNVTKHIADLRIFGGIPWDFHEFEGGCGHVTPIRQAEGGL